MAIWRTQMLLLLFSLVAVSCSSNTRLEANQFLDSFLPEFQRLYYEAAKAQWLANTDISAKHDSLSAGAEKKWAEYIGSREVIEKTHALLSRKDDLDTLQVLQLEKIWLQAAHRPATIPRVVDSLIDAATKTHIIDDAAQYYDYALSCVLKYHLHDYIARNILGQDPRNCNYVGNKEVGDFLKGIMRPGASRDWRIVLKKKTGESLSARAMLEYYKPLLIWLKEQNRGRRSVLADLNPSPH